MIRRCLLGLGSMLAIVAGLPVRAAAAPTAIAAAPGAEAQELAERYAPIVMLKQQDEDCDTYGEPFAPMAVDLVLDNPQVALRQVGNGDPTAMRAPGASDLFGLGEGFYLDFPGDALRPGCLFERDGDRYQAARPSVVYAHIAHQPDRPDLLAVQYWLYWYYNDWNNKHESDWEFVQVLLPASSVTEALDVDPTAVGYAQHEGGERAGWSDAKLDREGTHPVVYSSARSHASYFGSALYMGRGASEGFGCDNTDGPSTRVEPEVVVLPDTVDDPNDPLAWLAFDGRWGERHASPNNGPTGPATKPQWAAPVDWQDGLRDSSFVVPTGDSQAAQLVAAFCNVVEWGSVKFIQLVASPVKVLASFAIVVAIVAFLLRRTSWRKVAPLPVVSRRRAGEIARASASIYRRHPGTFAAVGALAVPVALLALVLGAVLSRLPLIGDLVTVADSEGTGSRLVISSINGGVFTALAFVVVSAAVAWIIGDPSGARPSVRQAVRAVGRRAGHLGTAFVPAAVIVVLLGLTFFGIPVAIWLLVRWQFLAQVTMLEGVGGQRTLVRSAALVRRRWWHTALVAALVTVTVTGIGLVVGLLLLVLFTGLPLWSLSAIVTACEVLLLPFGALVMTLLYGDAVASHAAGRTDAASGSDGDTDADAELADA